MVLGNSHGVSLWPDPRFTKIRRPRGPHRYDVLSSLSRRRVRRSHIAGDGMTDARWLPVWNRLPSRFGTDEHLRQVGRTLDGKPVGLDQVCLIVDDITSRLRLEPSDVLLDLCCGNGLLTSRLAEKCRRVVAIDFSEPLLTVARRDYSRANVEYRLGSVRRLSHLGLAPGSFTKVLMYDALQHFAAEDLRELLPQLKSLTARSSPMLF